MNSVMLSLTDADERLLLALIERRRPRIDTLMRIITRLGSWYLVVPATAFLASDAVPGVSDVGRLALVSLAASHLLVQLLKRTICRKRPALPVGFGFLIEPEDRFSFPSGHAAAGMSVALPLLLGIGGAVGAMVMLVGVAVGLSRCYLGVHYPGDVVMGWLLAAGCVLTAVFLGMPI